MTKSTATVDTQRDKSVEYFENALKMRDAMYSSDFTGAQIVGETQDAKEDL
jgi:hypothetical protein